MKIAYDISILGQGYVNPKARTGIYRVVESLLLELVRQDKITLNLIAVNGISSIWDEASAILYLQTQQSELCNYFQCCYVSQLKLDNIYQKAATLQRIAIQLALEKYPLLYKPAIALQVPFKLLAKLETRFHFKQNKFDVYHSLFYPIPPQNNTNKISRVLTIYDMIPVLNPKNFTQKIQQKFLRMLKSIDIKNDWIICISENSKQDFCGYTGMNPERVFVTPLAAGNHFYPVTQSELIKSTLKRYQIPDSPYLLSLCTLEPRKNLTFLIRCFSEIIADSPSLDLNLVLVGVRGWKNADIFKTVNDNPSLKSRIIFTGYIPDEDLSAIYSGATAFVYPSLYEGFGLPPLEAMQCGTPVITSNTSSLPEVVGDAGIMINPTQEDELCQAILNVVNDSCLRASLSQTGIEKASQFSWKKCAEETVKVYRIARE